MNESEFIKNFFQSTNLTPARQIDLFARISSYGGGDQPHTQKRDFLSLPMKKFNNKLPKWDSFWRLINQRKTDRNFTKNDFSFSQLEKIIAASFGKNRKSFGSFMHRSPSAGGLFGLQGYFICLKIKGLDPGIYYIDEEKEVLFQIEKRIPLNLEKIFFYNDYNIFKKSAGVFILCTDCTLTARKYGVRAIRFGLLDAGHCMQNICLATEKIKGKIIPIGGFDEEGVINILKIKNEWEFPVYAAILGK